jgi:signal transduction histidine kinase
MPDQRRAQQILSASKRLCAEVSLQRFLSNQKDSTNLLKMALVPISDITEEVELIMSSHPTAHLRTLEQKWPHEEVQIHTDIHLVSRVLGNMLLNAFEATAEGGKVRLNTTVNDTDIIWEVWNDAYIPYEIQLRIFQKHFSTKASMGRGMGTHSMKLLGEKYLNGEVTFSSSLEGGTIFSFKHPLHNINS